MPTFYTPTGPSWWLDVPVFTKGARSHDIKQFRPRLILTMKDHGEGRRVLGWIEKEFATTKGGNAPWLVHEWLSAPNAREHADEQGWGFAPKLREGETQTPRPSPQAALAFLLEAAAVAIPVCKDPAVGLVANTLLQPFQTASDAYQRRAVQLMT